MTINVRVRDGLCPDQTTGDGGATEGDIRGSFSDIIDVVGVKDLAGGHALVTQNSPADLSVLVAPGVVYIPNADYDELDSNQVKFWEAVITVSTAVAITANTSGSTRIDLICVKMDTTITPDEHASNIATLIAVAGTPGAGVPATPDNYAKLAEIEVANGASTIVTDDITDSRVQSTINSDYVGASVSVTTKGDLQTFSTVPTRLPVGTDGQILESRASETTGLKWITPSTAASFWTAFSGSFDEGYDQWTIVVSGSDMTSIFKKGVSIKWLSSADALKIAKVVSSSFGSSKTAIVVVGSTVASGDKSFYYGADVMAETFIIAGNQSTGTNVSKTWTAKTDIYPISVDAVVSTAGTTNSTTYDLNDDGTTVITTKPSIASTATTDLDNVVDTPTTAIAVNSLVTVDIDAASTTQAIDGYITLFYLPSWWISRT